MERINVTVDMINEIVRSCEKTIIKNIALIQEIERKFPNDIKRMLNVTLIDPQPMESCEECKESK